jgi:hypothetical protein
VALRSIFLSGLWASAAFAQGVPVLALGVGFSSGMVLLVRLTEQETEMLERYRLP